MVVIMYDYVMLPVRPRTKALVDEKKKEFGLKSYDATIARLASGGIYHALKKFEGVLKNAPRFERDKLERKIA